jgi:hypothetical protein
LPGLVAGREPPQLNLVDLNQSFDDRVDPSYPSANDTPRRSPQVIHGSTRVSLTAKRRRPRVAQFHSMQPAWSTCMKEQSCLLDDGERK